MRANRFPIKDFGNDEYYSHYLLGLVLLRLLRAFWLS